MAPLPEYRDPDFHENYDDRLTREDFLESPSYRFVDCWNRTFDEHCWGDPLFATASLHVLIGQLPHVRKMRFYRSNVHYQDPRVHLCYLSPSGSGKGAGASYVARMAKLLGIHYQELDEATDASLIGSVRLDRDGEREVKPGILDPSRGVDILGITEATMVLSESPKPYQENTMNIYQKAMNPMGSSDNVISKSLASADDIITVSPECSLFLTTYPPNNLGEIILNRGLLQRMLVVVRNLTIEDRLATENRINAQTFQPVDTAIWDAMIAKRLKKVDAWAGNVDGISFSKEGVAVLNDATKKMFEPIFKASPYHRERLGEFVTRISDLRRKLAFHHAILNQHETVERYDAMMAAHWTRVFFSDIVSWLEFSIEPPQEYIDQIENRRKEGLRAYEQMMDSASYKNSNTMGWLRMDHFIDSIRFECRVTKPTAEYIVDKLIDYGYFSTLEKAGKMWTQPARSKEAPEPKN